MRIRVLWFGRSSAAAFAAEIDSYRQRVGRRWPADDVVLKPARGGRDSDPGKALAQEAAAVRRHLREGWQLVVLDEGGRRVDSDGFAALLEGFEAAGTTGLLMVVGSDLGVHRELLREAHLCLSLSPLTLPHMIARLLLWEQLFRATHILGGGGYHRRTVQ